MLTLSKLPPKYVALDDQWRCDEDHLIYQPDFDKRVWRAVNGGRERRFAEKCIILKSLDCKVPDDTTTTT